MEKNPICCHIDLEIDVAPILPLSSVTEHISNKIARKAHQEQKFYNSRTLEVCLVLYHLYSFLKINILKTSLYISRHKFTHLDRTVY